MINKLAIIDPKAKISPNVKIGPYSIIGANVQIGEGSEIQSHVSIVGNTIIGNNNKIYPFVSIGNAHFKDMQPMLSRSSSCIVISLT